MWEEMEGVFGWFVLLFGYLADKHNVKIIVDEVLTSGVMNNAFVKHCQRNLFWQVCCVLMGKWTGCGMVLFNANHEVGEENNGKK